jgi:hypothetical protein
MTKKELDISMNTEREHHLTRLIPKDESNDRLMYRLDGDIFPVSSGYDALGSRYIKPSGGRTIKEGSLLPYNPEYQIKKIHIKDERFYIEIEEARRNSKGEPSAGDFEFQSILQGELE